MKSNGALNSKKRDFQHVWADAVELKPKKSVVTVSIGICICGIVVNNGYLYFNDYNTKANYHNVHKVMRQRRSKAMIHVCTVTPYIIFYQHSLI